MLPTVDLEKVLVEEENGNGMMGPLTSFPTQPIFSCVSSHVRTFTNVTFDKYIIEHMYRNACTETWNITVFVL